MAWVAFVSSGRLVVSARQTQAAANTAVTALGAGHATIEVDDGNSGHELPADFSPGFQYVTAGGVVSFDSPGTTDEDVQRETLLMHDEWQEWANGVDAISHQIAPANATKVHQWYYWMHYGAFKYIKGSDTNARKISWARASRMGPADAETVAQWCAQSVGILAPLIAVLIAHPTTAVRWNLAVAVSNTIDADDTWTADEPTVADLIGGSWIDGIA